MNMKKTIAAVAACAMAVSAMATTVSAVDENATAAKSVHYDLTIKEKKHTATLTFSGVASTLGTKLQIFIPYSVANCISNDVTVTYGSNSFVFSASTGSANYDGCAKIYNADLFDADGNLIGSTITGGVATADWVADTWVYEIDLSKSNGAQLANLVNSNSGDGTLTVVMKDVDALVDQSGMASYVSNNYAATVGLYDSTTPTYPSNLVSDSIVCTDGSAMLNSRVAVADFEAIKPMKSQINTNSKTAEIFTVLGTKGTKSNDSSYVNVKAVVNDMVANYDDVVFTFNTATANVLTDAYLADKSWIGNALNYAGYYVTNLPQVESWMGDSQYTSFAQQLYNLFGDEGTGYTYSDSYTFNNLFNAALVANNGYTMNQSTVAPFEYSKTSVSFSWSDLTGGNNYVSVASAVDTLQLATSSDWYWDSLDITGYELAAEDASTEAGIEDEGEDLDDEDDADDVDDIDDVDDADDIDDEDDDADVDVDVDVEDEAPVATNPSTGNAPIALAVIPVALAAAAVVAKKRG